MTTHNEKHENLAKELVTEYVTFADGRKSYDPIYFDQGFNDTDSEVVGEFIAGSKDWRSTGYDKLDEWVSDSIRHDASEIGSRYMKGDDVDEDIDQVDLEEEIRYLLHEEVTQDYVREWVTGMRDTAVRVQLDDKPDPVFVERADELEPEDILFEAGIEPSEHNIASAKVILANAAYDGCYYNLFLVFRLNLSAVKDDTDMVHIRGDAELWMTNVYAGDGMSETVHVDMKIKRNQLDTDENAAGWSYCSVFGTDAGYLPNPSIEFIKSDAEVEA